MCVTTSTLTEGDASFAIEYVRDQVRSLSVMLEVEYVRDRASAFTGAFLLQYCYWYPRDVHDTHGLILWDGVDSSLRKNSVHR